MNYKVKYLWNQPYQLIMKIKYDYIKTFNNLDTYDFNEWVKKLNKEEYNEFMQPLQITQHNNLLLIRYGLAELQRGMWEDENSIYRQCRSLVIDLENEEIVLSPFRKFFNLNEVEENKIETIAEKIKSATIIEITNKLDGSMQSARYYNGEYVMSGSKALDVENSWRLQEGYNLLTDSHKQMLKELQNTTFVFEYISPKNAHVVQYKQEDEGLYLIGMIDVNTGCEYYYSTIKAVATFYNIKHAEIENYTFDEILELSKTEKSEHKEGWVINIDDHKIKIKCDDYINLHRVLDKVSSINVIIQAIADNKYDDLISKVPEAYRNRVESTAKVIFDYVDKSNLYLSEMYNKAPKENKKEFMLWVDENIDKEYRGYIRCKYLGREYNVLKHKPNSYKKIKEIVGNDINHSALFGGE